DRHATRRPNRNGSLPARERDGPERRPAPPAAARTTQRRATSRIDGVSYRHAATTVRLKTAALRPVFQTAQNLSYYLRHAGDDRPPAGKAPAKLLSDRPGGRTYFADSGRN